MARVEELSNSQVTNGRCACIEHIVRTHNGIFAELSRTIIEVMSLDWEPRYSKRLACFTIIRETRWGHGWTPHQGGIETENKFTWTPSSTQPKMGLGNMSWESQCRWRNTDHSTHLVPIGVNNMDASPTLPPSLGRAIGPLLDHWCPKPISRIYSRPTADKAEMLKGN